MTGVDWCAFVCGCSTSVMGGDREGDERMDQVTRRKNVAACKQIGFDFFLLTASLS